MPYTQYVDAAQQFFDDLVDNADDDQLFAGGYLRGHFDLAVGYAQVENLPLTPDELNLEVEVSLVKAYQMVSWMTPTEIMVVIWEKLRRLPTPLRYTNT